MLAFCHSENFTTRDFGVLPVDKRRKHCKRELPPRALDTVVTFKAGRLFDGKALAPREQEPPLCIEHFDLHVRGSPEQPDDGNDSSERIA